jgi:serine/threonine-protein kinase
MADVFVSYKAEDRRRVTPLVKALEAEGLSVWWDEQIGGGSSWRREIEAELDAAKCVIVAWSKRSVGPEGEFVQDEATRAKQRHVYVPVTIDKVRVPLGFGETQALALTGWHGSRADRRYQAVLAAVRAITQGKTHQAHQLRNPDSRFSRRGVIAGGTVVAVATAGVGGWFLFRPSSARAATSIAVLPFENLSGDPNQAYFSDGIAEEIRSALARIAGLTVIGRSSSEAVRSDAAPAAAKKLGVRNILNGSVRQSPSTIRVTAELVDGETGVDRWSQDYNRTPGDAIRIQTDIAESVATALSYQLLPSLRKALTAGGTGNAVAQDRFLKGLALAARGEDEALKQALALFDSAIAIDPGYADAFASKAEVLTILSYNAPTDAATREDLAKALTAAQTAVKLAPERSNAQSALGMVLQWVTDFSGAAQSFENALELGADADTLRRIALFRTAAGGGPGGLQLINSAAELDPLNPLAQGDRGIVLYYLRRYQEALAALRDYLREQPDSLQHRSHLIFALILTSRLDEAENELPKISVEWSRLTDEALIAARRRDRTRGDRAIAGLEAMHQDLLSFQFAQIHAQRGEIDQAIARLRKAVLIHDSGLRALPTDPFLDPLRTDPRFQSLVAQLKFPAV